MSSVKEHCVTFPLNVSGAVDGKEVVRSLRTNLGESDIKCVQVTRTACIITLKNDAAKMEICLKGITVNNRHITVDDCESEITNIIIKDLPSGVSDESITTQLNLYGKLAPGSLVRNVYKGTNIETGTRSAKLLHVQNIIPNEASWGKRNVRLYCDNRKSACIYCESTEHMHFNCPNRRNKEVKRCYKCNSTTHLQRDCDSQTRTTVPSSGLNLEAQEGVIGFRGEEDIFSNLYRLENPLTYKGKKYPSVEHAYKSIKCLYYDKEELLDSISSITRGKTAMNFVNDELKLVEPNPEKLELWQSNQTDIMQEILDAKYEVCPEFQKKLEDTGDNILVEATSHPKWGSGIRTYKQTMQTHPKDYPGDNMMGILLMKLRDKHRKKNPQHADNIKPPVSSIIKDAVKDQLNTIREEMSTPVSGATGAHLPNEVETTTPAATAEQDETDDSTIVVITDSILMEASNKDATVVAKAGATLTDTEELIHDSVTKTQGKQVPSVVIALGANDISRHESSKVSAHLAKAVATATTQYPESTIYMSSIIERKGSKKEMKQANEKALEVNKFMRDTVSLYPNVKFICNKHVFSPGTINQVYKSKDSSGIHLSDLGKRLLLTNIVKKVQETQSSKTKKRGRSQATPDSAERKVKQVDTKETP